MTNRILKTSRGTQHGPINRLISPLAEGDDLKPFIFLDYINTHIQAGFGFPMHPHSGLATLTWQPNCDIKYEDTTGQNGILKAGGLEWMNAGGGAWHRAQFATGFIKSLQNAASKAFQNRTLQPTIAHQLLANCANALLSAFERSGAGMHGTCASN